VGADLTLGYPDLLRDLPGGQRLLPEKIAHALPQSVIAWGGDRGWFRFFHWFASASL
jgi:hypothetical protein